MYSLLLLYGSPDAILPVASILAAIGGLLLMGWNYVMTRVRQFVHSIRHRAPKAPTKVP